MIIINNETKAKKLDDKSFRKILGCGGSQMVEVHFKAGGIGEPHSHTDQSRLAI